ncbi:MAG TPA: hypothetical protein VFO41_05550 [Alphaproteobacteria bacterium]|nr:hypothetical protein [Alphaproteobacteria bacterium]
MGGKSTISEENMKTRYGGPGSSHQDATNPHPHPNIGGPAPGAPTNTRHSRVSGGGGERDSHQTHDPRSKGGQKDKAP